MANKIISRVSCPISPVVCHMSPTATDTDPSPANSPTIDSTDIRPVHEPRTLKAKKKLKTRNFPNLQKIKFSFS